MEQYLSEPAPGFVSLITMVETVWVLSNHFKMSGAQVAAAVERLLAADALNIQNEQQVFQAMIALKNGTGTFADALIGAVGVWAGCSSTFTFDEKAARKLPGFQLVSPGVQLQ
jgi:predicted nucleic-acid-binding protein